MATSPYVEIILNGQRLIGPVNLPGKEGTFEIFEFYHQISAVGENEFTEEIVREHKSIEFVKAVDSISTTLYKVLTLNRIIDKVIINWYNHDEKTNRDEVYFQHILERVKVTSVKMYMPNVKDKRYEHFPHLEKVTLRYDWITFHCPDGNRTFKEQWAFAFLLFGMNRMKYAEDEKALTSSAVSDEMIDDEPNGKLNIKNLRWEHTDEHLKKDSSDAASEGNTIKLLADFENFVEGAGVDFFVSDMSSGKKKQLKKIHTRCNKMAAEVEWKVNISKAGEEPDIIFEVEARSLLNGPCEIKIHEELVFKFELPINPEEPAAQDDKFILTGNNGYEKTLTVKDDTISDDDKLTLIFKGIQVNESYTLAHDNGSVKIDIYKEAECQE